MASACRQPQGRAQVDWSNPLTRGLQFALVSGEGGAIGFAANTTEVQQYMQAGAQSGVAMLTPVGIGVKPISSAQPAYAVSGVSGISSSQYSLFAVATANSQSTNQNAIDDDLGSGTSRKYQFRLSNGAAGISVFNGSTGIGVYSSVPLTLEELNRGFTMSASVTPTLAVTYQNRRRTQGALSGANIPNNNFWVGALKRGTNQGWTTGAISLVAGWSRTLTDAEHLSLADNPWQLFLDEDENGDLLLRTYASGGVSSFTYTGSGGLTYSGTTSLVKSKTSPTSGGITFSGTGSALSGNGAQSRVVTASGGMTFTGSPPQTRSAVRLTSGGISYRGGVSVVLSPDPQPVAAINNRKRGRRPRWRIV